MEKNKGESSLKVQYLWWIKITRIKIKSTFDGEKKRESYLKVPHGVLKR